jgi:hypothetical protein
VRSKSSSFTAFVLCVQQTNLTINGSCDFVLFHGSIAHKRIAKTEASVKNIIDAYDVYFNPPRFYIRFVSTLSVSWNSSVSIKDDRGIVAQLCAEIRDFFFSSQKCSECLFSEC